MYKYQTRLCNPLSFTSDENVMIFNELVVIFNELVASNTAVKMKQAGFRHDFSKLGPLSGVHNMARME